MGCFQKKFEKELVSLFDKFKRDFPDSEYLPYLVSMVESIVEFHERAELPFNENVKIIENFDSLNSLRECLKILQGKKVYADIWSTSCGYCKDEFKYSEELKKHLDSLNIAMLYVSLDGDNNHVQWQNMIKYYNLKGFHMRANEEVYSDLKLLFGNFGIPRYLIIDEKGEIINKNAKRLSQLMELKKQL